jgi:hypothetical protein
MKNRADKKRTERTFIVGEEVFIKLQPYIQQSLVKRSDQKLAFRYFGPYPVSKCINPVAYEVQLPPETKIHPVFHVSQLRKVLKQGMHASSSLPKLSDDIPRPVNILEHRWRHTPSGRREQVQVQWPPDSAKDLTWEDKLQLQHQFPEILAWGQANSQGEGDVNSNTDKQKSREEVGLKERSPRPKRLIQPNRRHTGPDWTR